MRHSQSHFEVLINLRRQMAREEAVKRGVGWATATTTSTTTTTTHPPSIANHPTATQMVTTMASSQNINV